MDICIENPASDTNGEGGWRTLPTEGGRCTVLDLDVRGAEGPVRDMISWIARRSFSRCGGLLMPISRWISVSDKLAMMAPLLTLARQAATYHAGMPTHSWTRGRK